MPHLPIGTLDGILAAEDSQPHLVDVPAWGCSVSVRGLTRAQVRQFAAPDVTPEREDQLVLHWCLVEPKVSEEEAAQLLTKSFGATKLILDEIHVISGLSQRPEDKRDDHDSFRPAETA